VWTSGKALRWHAFSPQLNHASAVLFAGIGLFMIFFAVLATWFGAGPVGWLAGMWRT
jgi:hypothetical protein